MPETVAALLGAVVVAAAVDAATRPTRLTWIVLGLAAGLATLTRAESGLLLAFVAVPAAVVGRRSWRPAAVVVVAAAVVVAPWSIRNSLRFHELEPISTNLGSVIDGANCDATYGGPLLGYWVYNADPTSRDCFEGFTQRELRYLDDESLVADFHRHAGWHYANHHVGDWPKVALARLGRTVAVFRPGQMADLGALEGRSQRADTAGFVLLWATLVLGTVGALDLRRRRRPWWIPAVAVVAVWGATALTYGNPRFLASAQPSLVALAAVGAVSLAARRRRRGSIS
jgi:hypothetical protein